MKSLLTSNQFVLLFVLLFTNSMIAQSDVVINEFMASNDTAIADQDGDFDDWIELYNNSDMDIDISGYMLSDDSTEPMKFVFPAGTIISQNGYVIIWCDDDQEQVGFHTGFKLSGGGEEIVLSDASGEQLDYIDYGEQQTDFSSARIPNGTGDFVIGEHSNNANNDITSLVELGKANDDVVVFPNPSAGIVEIRSQNQDVDNRNVKLYNMQGQSVKINKISNTSFELSHLSGGIYFLLIDDSYLQRLVIDYSK